ncbi:CFC_HP_G0068210.mRNA.1.CDS.1 [Saccharomyces cerevisiae]|nr:CFC_HP_G0068210.mRNA.1.CDS.1 [Saccharomyces cerevisiae]CAI6647483.1 CFC_HP_G0068210.mRNA.1.CDS.1 [Saccharomyces cerevisiae]
MGREPEFARQMVRTQARPVVRGDVTPTQAFEFAALIGTLGVSILYFALILPLLFLVLQISRYMAGPIRL